MKSSTFVLALAVGASASILPRDGATTLADISTIDSDTKALITAVGTDPLSLADVVNAEQALETAVKDGTTHATGVSFSEDESAKVFAAIKSLIPRIVNSLNGAVFSDALKPYASLVQTNLKSLASESDALSDALSSAASNNAKDAAKAAKDCINEAFASAAATKSAVADCTAKIVIPDSSSPTTAVTSDSPTATGSATEAPTSTGEAESSTEAPSASTTAASYPSGTSTTAAVGGTAAPTGTYVAPAPFTGSASSVKVGMSGLFFGALALFL